MSGKAHITSHFATTRDVASRLRIPADRVAELLKRYDVLITHPDGSATVLEFKTSGKKTKAARRTTRTSSTRRAAMARAKKKK